MRECAAMNRYGVALLFVLVTLPGIHVIVTGQAPGGQPPPAQAPGGPDGRGARGGRAGGGPFAKVPGQLASGWNASSTVARTKLRHEWVDIPVGSGKVHTWIEYPDGEARTGVVIVMSYEAGLDEWMRSVADELAASGYIALAPDVLTGLGPNRGNYDA